MSSIIKGLNEALKDPESDRLVKNIIAQNPKGSAAEKMTLTAFMNSKSFPKDDSDGEEWIGIAAKWLNANKVFLKNHYPELDLSDLQSLAEKMYEDYLAKMGKLEETNSTGMGGGSAGIGGGAGLGIESSPMTKILEKPLGEEVDEGQIYSTGGGAGQAYRKFTPKKSSGIVEGLDDWEKREFKRKELEHELRHERNNYAVHINGRLWKIFDDKKQAENIAASLRRKGKDAKVYITGASVKEEQAPMFTPEEKMVNANDPGSDGWRWYKTKESAIMKGLQREEKKLVSGLDKEIDDMIKKIWQTEMPGMIQDGGRYLVYSQGSGLELDTDSLEDAIFSAQQLSKRNLDSPSMVFDRKTKFPVVAYRGSEDLWYQKNRVHES